MELERLAKLKSDREALRIAELEHERQLAQELELDNLRREEELRIH